MKTTFLFLMLFNVCAVGYSQTKKELLYALEDFQFKKVSNQSYDVTYEKLWDAIYAVGSSEYSGIKRESESRGYIEFFLEQELYKENLTIEIRGDKSPYRVQYSIEKQQRTKNLDGTFTVWQISTDMSRKYLNRLETKMYTALFGPIEYPAELLEKIEKYNSMQDKDRKKILLGRDY